MKAEIYWIAAAQKGRLVRKPDSQGRSNQKACPGHGFS